MATQGKRKHSQVSETVSDNESASSSDVTGLLDFLDGPSNEFNCPICFEIIEDAQVTECGHTFCAKCISQSLETKNRCPTCSHEIDKVFPNFMLNDTITKRRKNILTKKCTSNPESSKALAEWHQLVAIKAATLNQNDIDLLLTALKEKKKEFEKNSKILQTELLRGFLNQARKYKQDQLAVIMNELNIIEQDAARLQKISDASRSSSLNPIANPSTETSTFTSSSSSTSTSTPTSRSDATSSHQQINDDPSKLINKSTVPDEFKSTDTSIESVSMNATLTNRWRKMKHHFEDLQQCYLNTRKSVFSSHASNFDDGSKLSEDLDDFRETLNKITSCNNLKTLSTLCYTSDPVNEPSIVSSIEFDKDNEIFATAGVTKVIKLFDYSTVIKDSLTISYPIAVLECKSKISCVSWSSYYKSSMATSDYEGAVTIWDVFTKQKINCFQEHERRCWSVDFNKIDTHLITSGSDDGTVKLWSLNMDSSVATLKASANVCCAKFNPRSRYHVAFASADHCAYYYDLRNPKIPEAVFKDHRKAVSYVKFLSWDEIISASTDSQLKLWNTNRNQCLRSFKGHINEKNFVGLATDGDYISCGSENNALYFYYKGFSKPILIYSFDTDKTVHPAQFKDRTKKDALLSDFVSAICWKGGENVIIAANSQGIIKILELI